MSNTDVPEFSARKMPEPTNKRESHQYAMTEEDDERNEQGETVAPETPAIVRYQSFNM